MQKKQVLSKKQQKKLKYEEKLRNQEKLEVVGKAFKQNSSQLKQKNIEKQQSPAQSQSQEQQIEQNGDIDFNQLQQIEDNPEKIDVTFLIAQIREEYYHSMKTVMLRYGQIVSLTESELAGEILQKGNLGNVVVAEDDEDEEQQEENDQDQQQEDLNDQLNVYSVVTLLPSSSKITQKIKKQAKSSLQKNKEELQKNYSKAIQALTTQKACSFLVSARLPNLPSFIVCNSHEVFASDLQDLRKKTPKHPIFQSECVLSVSEVQITNSQTKSLDELIFSKFEDYEFCQKSLCWWVGGNIKSQRQKADLRKLYFIIRLKDYLEAVNNIKNYLEDV